MVFTTLEVLPGLTLAIPVFAGGSRRAGLLSDQRSLGNSDLCRQPKSRKPHQRFPGKPVESVLGEVSKDTVLEFVDELESGEAVTLKVSHEEDVPGWVSAISEYLEKAEGPCRSVSW